MQLIYVLVFIVLILLYLGMSVKEGYGSYYESPVTKELNRIKKQANRNVMFNNVVTYAKEFDEHTRLKSHKPTMFLKAVELDPRTLKPVFKHGYEDDGIIPPFDDIPQKYKYYKFYNDKHDIHSKTKQGEIYKPNVLHERYKVHTHKVDDHDTLFYGIKN